MPTNLNLKVGLGFEGRAVGTATNVDLNTLLGRESVLTTVTGAGKQVFERWEVPITLTTTAVTTLNLISGMVNPLNESISGTAAFLRVLAVLIQHDDGSVSPNIEAFGGTVGSLFQGPLGTTVSVALTRGAAFGFNVPYVSTTASAGSTMGWTVNSTAKNIELRNLGTTVATVNVLILGTV